MIIQGTVKELLGVRHGISQRTGQQWSMQDVLVEYKETQHQQTPDSVILSVNSDLLTKEAIQPGDPITAAFTLEVREYNGRRYNQVTTRMFRRGWPEPKPQTEEKPNDLPFN